MKKTFNRIMIWLLMFATAITFTFPNIDQAFASSSLINLQKVLVTDQLDQEKTSFNFADQIKYQIKYSSQGYNGVVEVYWYVYDASGSKIYDSWNKFSISNGSSNTASTPTKILPNSPSGNYQFIGTVIWDDLGRTRSASQTVTFSVSNNNSSSSAGWSQGSQIGGQLGGLPGKPEVIIPSQGANLPYGDVKIDWQDITGVDYYYFQLYDGVYQNGKQTIMNTHPTTSYVNVTSDKLQKGKSYQYWIWAHNSLGFSEPITGTFSIESKQQITSEFKKPTIVTPRDQQILETVTPTIEWVGITSAQYYYMQIYEGVYENGKQAILSDWLVSPSYTVPAGKLQFGKKYQLWLWAYNGSSWTESTVLVFEISQIKLSDFQNMTNIGAIELNGEAVTNKSVSTYPGSYNSFKIKVKNLGSTATELIFSLEGVDKSSFLVFPNHIPFEEKELTSSTGDLRKTLSSFQEVGLYFKFNLPETVGNNFYNPKLVVKNNKGEMLARLDIPFFVQSKENYLKEQATQVLGSLYNFMFGHWYTACDTNKNLTDFERLLAIAMVGLDVVSFGGDRIIIKILDNTGKEITKEITRRELLDKLTTEGTNIVQKEMVAKFLLSIEGKKISQYIGEEAATKLLAGFSKDKQTQWEVLKYLIEVLSKPNFISLETKTGGKDAIRGFFAHLGDFNEIKGAKNILERLSQTTKEEEILNIFNEARVISELKTVHGHQLLEVFLKKDGKEIFDVLTVKNGKITLHEIKNGLVRSGDVQQFINEFKYAKDKGYQELVIWSRHEPGREIAPEALPMLKNELDKTGIRYTLTLENSYDGIYYQAGSILLINFLPDQNNQASNQSINDNTDLLKLSAKEYSDSNGKVVWSKNNSIIEITSSPSAPNNTQKEWLYDLDYARVNQFQWKKDLPEKTTIKAKISWETPDGYYGGLTLGGIGLIDENGYFHNFVGLNDGGAGGNDLGELGVILRDYRRNSYYQGEVWKFSQKMTSPNGSADLKIEKDGNHIKIFINNQFLLEQDIKGKIAGLALGTSGHLHFPFGTVKLEELSFSNQDHTAKETIANAQNQTDNTISNSPTNNSIGKQIQQPLFPSSFGDTPWISANSYHKGQANWYPEISFKFDQLVSKIKLHYLLRNGWYKPTGFKIIDLSSGKELAKRENSIDMYDKTEEIEFSQPSNNFKFVSSNPNGDYVIFYSHDSLVYVNNNSVDKVAGSPAKDDLDKMIRNNLLGQSWQEYNDGGKLVWEKTDQGLKIDESPSAVNNTQKEWLYDLDHARINQFQWKMDIPEKTTVNAKISWETTGYGLMIGGIGLIDENGYFHHFVGLNDGGAGGNDLGELGVILRDYRRNSYYQGEVWKFSQKMTSPNGLADLKIEKDGQHVKIYINKTLILEQDIKGKIAGLALGTSGHLHFPFGTFKLENLTIQ